MLIVLAVLPSSLNLPQSNPTETLEYAPVPPDDANNPPPAAGNLGSLGLGTSSGIADQAAPSLPPAPAAAKDASSKLCVGNPPRQTEDPLSPPCVAFFQGDNFGATYQGVTRDEIRVLFYFEGASGQLGTSRGSEESTSAKYIDVAKPPADDEHVWVRMLRLYQRYFNQRYQTYGRFVHFFAYYDALGAASPESRRADAAENYEKIKPFAVFNQASFGFGEEYTAMMAKRGVLVFAGEQNERRTCCLPVEYFEAFPRLVWSVAASTERYAQAFSRFLCSRVIGRPVSYGGNAGDRGRPRRLGLVVNRRAGFEQETRLAMLVKDQVRACGGRFVDEATNTGNLEPDAQSQTTADMVRFRQSGVTTIIWPGGPDTAGADGGGHQFGIAAAGIRYHPEVVLAGGGSSEGVFNGQVQNQEFWRHVMAITQFTRADNFADRPCVQAAREADPDAPQIDLNNFGCQMYPAVRLMFTGIQVAGPRAGPTSVDKGFHAIPPVASTDPRVPACFFETGDYTCVKDTMLVWWDPSGRDPGSSGNGCMRMVEGGRRYLTDGWPRRDIAADRRLGDLCNRQGYAPA